MKSIQKTKYKNAVVRAQTMTEYLLLVCMIAIALIPVTTVLSKVIQEQVNVSARRIAGLNGESDIKKVAEQGKGKTKRDLSDFFHQ
jgi:Flp pilus assembly pilin Flp